MRRIELRGAAIAMGIAACGGCYSGVAGFDGEEGPTRITGDDGADGADDGADGADDGADGADDGDPAAQCEGDVGTSSLARLNRTEYDNTIRDLLGIEGSPAAGFSADSKVAGFDVADAPAAELDLEGYIYAAEELAATAVEDLADLLPCDPGLIGEDACAEELVDELGLRAYRRPLTDSEAATLLGIYAQGKADVGFTRGIELVVAAVLQSPHFLYHVDIGEPDPEAPGRIRLSPHAVASRLSYFLWRSMPDDELFDAAAAGELQTDEEIEAQARRMLADPRARDTVASFTEQWLGIDMLDVLPKDEGLFPAWGVDTWPALRAETRAFAANVVMDGDARLETLLTAAWTIADPALAEHYEGTIVEEQADGMARLELDPTRRAGLVTQASVLAMHAHENQSSPVHRGKFVREQLLCTILPDPPPDVDDTPPQVDPNATTRERFAQHTSDPSCAGCHQLIDGLGFGFEHYDPIGRWRTMDGSSPVDASGEILGTDDMDGPFDGAVELAAKLAGSEQVHECLAKQWFRFALSRYDKAEDQCDVEELGDAFVASGGDIRELLVAIAKSRALRTRVPAEVEG